jgi:hypothetical protein
MPGNIKVAFYLLKSNGRRKPTMAHKLLSLSLLVVCVTILIFTCSLHNAAAFFPLNRLTVHLILSVSFFNKGAKNRP